MLRIDIRKPFQVVSKLGVRYTGIFDHISQEDQTICLSQGKSAILDYEVETHRSVQPRYRGSTDGEEDRGFNDYAWMG